MIYFLKIELNVQVSSLGYTKNTTSTILFKVNQKPQGGMCGVDIGYGYAFKSIYNIKCIGWTDSDGKINHYEYYCKLSLNFKGKISGF